jgi:hypothetical protein
VQSFPDAKILLSQISSKEARMDKWHKDTEKEIEALKKESFAHRDIIFSPTVDVYRNLPAKLLAFYQWYVANYPYEKNIPFYHGKLLFTMVLISVYHGETDVVPW